MVVQIYITSYNRPEMLQSVLDHLDEYDVNISIYDDGSDKPLDDERVVRLAHGGKENYWKVWAKMLHNAETNLADLYIFMPDDFQALQVDRIKELHHRYKHTEYIYNIINDGRTKQWVGLEPFDVDEHTTRVGFTDCGFFCNRPALHKLGFYMKQTPTRWWEQGENISSGVGMMLSERAHRQRIPIYLPKTSLAYHGDHDSMMHPQERKNNPLKSK